MEDLKSALNKEKRDENAIISYIKVIRKKQLTMKLLKSTLIGKLFSTILAKKSSLKSKEICELAENTLNIWKQMNKAYKKE